MPNDIIRKYKRPQTPVNARKRPQTPAQLKLEKWYNKTRILKNVHFTVYFHKRIGLEKIQGFLPLAKLVELKVN